MRIFIPEPNKIMRYESAADAAVTIAYSSGANDRLIRVAFDKVPWRHRSDLRLMIRLSIWTVHRRRVKHISFTRLRSWPTQTVVLVEMT